MQFWAILMLADSTLPVGPNLFGKSMKELQNPTEK